MNRSVPPDLVHHLVISTGLPPSTAARIVTDVISYFGETIEEFVRRRHSEMRHRQYKNTEIWATLLAELACRPVTPESLSERQLRRIVYG